LKLNVLLSHLNSTNIKNPGKKRNQASRQAIKGFFSARFPCSHRAQLEFQEELAMKKSGLIDMFGLSSDPISNDQLDGLLFRFESDARIAREGDSKNPSLPFLMVDTATGYESDDMLFNTSDERERTISPASDPTLQ
jgi:hypothetical protein